MRDKLGGGCRYAELEGIEDGEVGRIDGVIEKSES